mmetsp:Transcript_82260/g.233237  ORF Transcript_82260/g.233237 Transcript_82260/m.233237 type:complete len:231 (+) Transcript_82260:1586-2278(+)
MYWSSDASSFLKFAFWYRASASFEDRNAPSTTSSRAREHAIPCRAAPSPLTSPSSWKMAAACAQACLASSARFLVSPFTCRCMLLSATSVVASILLSPAALNRPRALFAWSRAVSRLSWFFLPTFVSASDSIIFASPALSPNVWKDSICSVTMTSASSYSAWWMWVAARRRVASAMPAASPRLRKPSSASKLRDSALAASSLSRCPSARDSSVAASRFGAPRPPSSAMAL